MTAPDHVSFVTPFGTLEFRLCDGPWSGPAIFLYVESSRRILYVGHTDRADADLRESGPWSSAQAACADCIYAAPIGTACDGRALERWLIACFEPPLNEPPDADERTPDLSALVDRGPR